MGAVLRPESKIRSADCARRGSVRSSRPLRRGPPVASRPGGCGSARPPRRGTRCVPAQPARIGPPVAALPVRAGAACSSRIAGCGAACPLRRGLSARRSPPVASRRRIPAESGIRRPFCNFFNFVASTFPKATSSSGVLRLQGSATAEGRSSARRNPWSDSTPFATKSKKLQDGLHSLLRGSYNRKRAATSSPCRALARNGRGASVTASRDRRNRSRWVYPKMPNMYPK